LAAVATLPDGLEAGGCFKVQVEVGTSLAVKEGSVLIDAQALAARRPSTILIVLIL